MPYSYPTHAFATRGARPVCHSAIKKVVFFLQDHASSSFSSSSFQVIKQLRLAGTVVSFQSHIFLVRKTEPHDEATYWGDNNHKILNDLLSCEYICMASYCWGFWIKQQGNVRCPPKQPGRRAAPFSSLDQSILGSQTVHKTIGWLNYSAIVRKGSAAPFTSYHPQPNLVLDCFNSNLMWIYISKHRTTFNRLVD